MPKAFPAAFRRDVVAVARRGELSLNQIAKDFGLSPSCVQRWVRAADTVDGLRPSAGSTAAPPTESAEVRELRRRNRLLEQENEILRRAAAYLSRDLLPK